MPARPATLPAQHAAGRNPAAADGHPRTRASRFPGRAAVTIPQNLTADSAIETGSGQPTGRAIGRERRRYHSSDANRQRLRSGGGVSRLGRV